MAQNLYDILGLQKGASEDEIKRAYRKLAQKHHPDSNKGDPQAEQKFKELSAAYEILSDKQKRAQYDQFGDSAFANGGNGGQGGNFNGFDFGQFNGFGDNLADIFESFFGGGQRGRRPQSRGSDRGLDITLTFEEAVFGTERSFELERILLCEECKGSGGAAGSKIVNCDKCNGTGAIQTIKNTILGQVSSRRVCEVCNGEGKVPEKSCKECSGAGVVSRIDNLKIKIPAGIDNGSTLKLTGKGDAAPRGGVAGDLYVNIKVKAHKSFTRKGSDIYSEQTIHLAQAVLGTNLDVPTIHGVLNMKVPPGTQSGRLFKLSNQGVAKLRGEGNGDHYVTIIVDIPQKISKKERELYTQIAQEKGIEVLDEKGFLGKMFE